MPQMEVATRQAAIGPPARELEILEEMAEVATAPATEPDPRIQELLNIRSNLCP